MTPRIAACAVLGLLLLVPGPAAAQHPGAPAVRPDGHVLLAWLHGVSGGEAQLASLPGVSVVSPTWWHLDRSDPGSLSGPADAGLADAAAARGVAVWPTLSNRLDGALAAAVLGDGERRGRLVQETAAAVYASKAAGVVVDLQNLRESTGPALSVFVHELAGAVPDRTIAVTVAPRSDRWSLGEWSNAYDRRALAAAADFVILQALDEHDDARPGGPTASLDWTREQVEALLPTVPDRQIILAVPLYAHDWALGPAGPTLAAIRGMDAMATHLATAGAEQVFDPVAGQRRYGYVDRSGVEHVVWQESTESLGRRAALATTYNLAGVAAWRAGFGGPPAWSALSSALAADPRPGGQASGPPRLNRLVPVPRVAGPDPERPARYGAATRPASPQPPAPTVALAPVVAAVLLVLVSGGLLAYRGRARARR